MRRHLPKILPILLLALLACDEGSGASASDDAARIPRDATVDATPARPDAHPIEPDALLDATPVAPDAVVDATPVAPDAHLDAAPVEPDATPVEPDALLDATPIEPDAGPVEPDAAPVRLCGDALAAALSERTAGMILMSESDYGLDPIVLPPDGRAEVELADAIALFGDPDAYAEELPTDDLRRRMTRLDDPQDPQAVQLSEQGRDLFKLLDAQLVDPHYFRVNLIEVNVYYLGRSACGELAGFHSISVET